MHMRVDDRFASSYLYNANALINPTLGAAAGLLHEAVDPSYHGEWGHVLSPFTPFRSQVASVAVHHNPLAYVAACIV